MTIDLLSRDIMISLGWLTVFLFSLNTAFYFLKRGLRHLKPDSPVNYKKLVKAHKILGLLIFLLAFLHVVKHIPFFTLTVGWGLLLAFSVLISTGMIAAMFEMGKKLRVVHIGSLLLFITLITVHVTTKLLL